MIRTIREAAPLITRSAGVDLKIVPAPTTQVSMMHTARLCTISARRIQGRHRPATANRQDDQADDHKAEHDRPAHPEKALVVGECLVAVGAARSSETVRYSSR